MGEDPISGAIATGANFTSQMIGGGLNLLGNYMTNQANANLNKQTRDWNLKMWQMQNDYNTPAAQMARLKAAGLNPNLIYSQGNPGNAGAVQSTSPTVYRAPSVDMPNVMDLIGILQGFQNLELTEQKTRTESARQYNIAEDYRTKARINDWYSMPYMTDENGKKVGNDPTNYMVEQIRKLKLLQSSQDLQSQLLRIRTSEAGLSEMLKPYGMTNNDPAWLRGLFFLGDKTGLLKRYLSPGTLKDYRQ